MKQTIIAANWKMNLTVHEASTLVHRLNENIKTHRDIEIILAPNFVALQPLSLEIDHRKFKLAAQNAYIQDSGAYTGEVSFSMLRNLVSYCLIGHSERRIYFNETLEVVRDKVQAAIRNGIRPILCVGETSHERTNGETRRVVHDQVTTALSNLTSEEIEQVVIAYEPVWAISTFGGQVAKPDDIQKVMKLIRHSVYELYGQSAADHISILYGGSVKADTVGAYLALEDCNGALVGGASLVYKEFAGIVDRAYQVAHQ
ncbi:MAG: triose-phosphate isomerase [Candidatus Saccharimonadales bacterium]